MADELITYDDVAQWLPTEIRETIEAAAPCSGQRPHEWRHYYYTIEQFGIGTVRYMNEWTCSNCGRATHENPTPRGEHHEPL